MEKPTCPACSNQETVCSYKNIYGAKSLLRCKICGLYFVRPRPTPDRGRQIYTEDYYNAWALDKLGLEGVAKVKQATFGQLLNIIANYRNSGSLLDVGCAFGHLLDMAKEWGWDCYGVEIIGYAANAAMNKTGADKIWVGDFLELALPENNFDIITMVDFIEHTYDMKRILERCKKLLKNNGLLVIVTPNIGSFSRRCMGKYWPNFKEEHVVYFSMKSAVLVLNLHGFNVLEIGNFKKVLNFYYIRSYSHIYIRGIFIFLVEVLNTLLPTAIKKMNFFFPQGEMLIVAQKK